MYEHEIDKPAVRAPASLPSGMGCHEFKGQAMDTAYGQAGKAGCAADYKKMAAQAAPCMSDAEQKSGY